MHKVLVTLLLLGLVHMSGIGCMYMDVCIYQDFVTGKNMILQKDLICQVDWLFQIITNLYVCAQLTLFKFIVCLLLY